MELDRCVHEANSKGDKTMSEKIQGFEGYTPSRLEWLVVMLNSMVNYVNVPPGESSAV